MGGGFFGLEGGVEGMDGCEGGWEVDIWVRFLWAGLLDKMEKGLLKKDSPACRRVQSSRRSRQMPSRCLGQRRLSD